VVSWPRKPDAEVAQVRLVDFLVQCVYDALWRGAAYLPDRQNLHYNLELRSEYGILY